MILLELRYYTDPGQAEDSVVAEVRGALTLLESLEDHEGQARAWRLLTLVNWEACRWGASETAVKRMIEQARLAGDFVLQARMLPALVTCALYGPRPVPDAIEICHNILETAGGDRKAAAVTTRDLALLEAMRGRFGVARDLYRKSRATLDELGWHLHAALTSLCSGPVEMLAGDPAAAEAELRRDYTALEKMGEKYYLSTTAGYLASALLQQGRDEEADRVATVSERLATPHDISSQFLWRTVRGRVLARRGLIEDGEALIQEALEIIGRAEEPDSQAAVWADLAEVLATGGRWAEARTALQNAASGFEAKGNIVSAAQAKQRLDTLVREGVPASAQQRTVPTTRSDGRSRSKRRPIG